MLGIVAAPEGLDKLIHAATIYLGAEIIDMHPGGVEIGLDGQRGAPPVFQRVVDKVGQGSCQGKRLCNCLLYTSPSPRDSR